MLRERERDWLNKWIKIKRPEWTVLTLLLTVGEPKRITAIITRSISGNSEKRQHTKTRARAHFRFTRASRCGSVMFNQKAFLFNVNLGWLSLFNKYENRRGSHFGADVRKYEFWMKSGQSEHRHEANSTGTQTMRRKNIKQYHHSRLLSIERPQSSSLLPTIIPVVLPTPTVTLN